MSVLVLQQGFPWEYLNEIYGSLVNKNEKDILTNAHVKMENLWSKCTFLGGLGKPCHTGVPLAPES